jgi:hypothetical protein
LDGGVAERGREGECRRGGERDQIFPPRILLPLEEEGMEEAKDRSEMELSETALLSR